MLFSQIELQLHATGCAGAVERVGNQRVVERAVEIELYAQPVVDHVIDRRPQLEVDIPGDWDILPVKLPLDRARVAERHRELHGHVVFQLLLYAIDFEWQRNIVFCKANVDSNVLIKEFSQLRVRQVQCNGAVAVVLYPCGDAALGPHLYAHERLEPFGKRDGTHRENRHILAQVV